MSFEYLGGLIFPEEMQIHKLPLNIYLYPVKRISKVL